MADALSNTTRAYGAQPGQAAGGFDRADARGGTSKSSGIVDRAELQRSTPNSGVLETSGNVVASSNGTVSSQVSTGSRVSCENISGSPTVGLSLADSATDEQLMEAYADGDMKAAKLLHQRYAKIVLGILTRDLARPEDAHDLMQQCFLQLHRHRRDYERGRPFRPWFMTIAFNLKRQYFRVKKRRPEAELSDELQQRIRSKDVPADVVNARETLRKALAELNEDQREVVALHWFGGVPLPEVSQIVGASLSAVKVRAHRAYAKMRKYIAEDG